MGTMVTLEQLHLDLGVGIDGNTRNVAGSTVICEAEVPLMETRTADFWKDDDINDDLGRARATVQEGYVDSVVGTSCIVVFRLGSPCCQISRQTRGTYKDARSPTATIRVCRSALMEGLIQQDRSTNFGGCKSFPVCAEVCPGDSLASITWLASSWEDDGWLMG
ncbi:MAG: hypothetical protein Q9199_003858 [Rusavskia elegans]